ncbi:hypothetical protein MiYa_00190 [Microcystis aeruginosa NIES-2519]|uniref:Uncharacterized protein n=1 Tax=Microcystis aeruginosa NIES-2519 TaxID=2303981 RepID=A0A5A5R2J1_MICAE|nr:hypothetical protein B5D77_09805 [Microcystis sp. MC19]GCA68675.1 hypothetical protein MiYa_00190 [Microcystis aeruginosa NIES-2519]
MRNSTQICLNRPLGKQLTRSSFCQGLLRCAYFPLLLIWYELCKIPITLGSQITIGGVLITDKTTRSDIGSTYVTTGSGQLNRKTLCVENERTVSY